jgi:arylsulfatase A-like enzyme
METGSMEDWDPRRQLPAGHFFVSWGDVYQVFTAFPTGLPGIGEGLQARGYLTAAITANPLDVGSGLLASGFDLVASGATPGAAVNRLAREVIEHAPRDRPLALLVHYMDVHEYRSWAAGGGAAIRDEQTLRNEYARRVAESDRHLGDLLDSWSARHPLSESLVAFFSDHGEHLAEAGEGGLRHGDSMDEVLLRIPLVVSYPTANGIPAGVENRPVSLADLAPTVLEAAGASEAAVLPFSGRSLRSALPDERPLFADHQLSGDELSSISQGDLKLIVNWTLNARSLRELPPAANEAAKAGEATWELDDPERRRALEAAFDSYLEAAEARAGELRFERDIDAERLREQLRVLGYAE